MQFRDFQKLYFIKIKKYILFNLFKIKNITAVVAFRLLMYVLVEDNIVFNILLNLQSSPSF